MIEYHGISDNFDLEGKTAVITGGASGIGLATARFFARKGMNTILVDLNPGTEEIAGTVGRAVMGACGSILERDFVKRVIDDAISRFAGIDVLVNSAGIVALEKAEKMSAENWDKTIEVNLKGTFLVSQLFASALIDMRSPGSIINIASQAGVIALDGHAAYAASKGGMIALSKTLASEWAAYGIRVNCISPTYVLTDEFKRNVDWDGPEGDRLKRDIPAGRFAEPDEIAAVAAFLAGNNSAMITGQNILVDGGYTVR